MCKKELFAYLFPVFIGKAAKFEMLKSFFITYQFLITPKTLLKGYLLSTGHALFIYVYESIIPSKYWCRLTSEFLYICQQKYFVFFAIFSLFFIVLW